MEQTEAEYKIYTNRHGGSSPPFGIQTRSAEMVASRDVRFLAYVKIRLSPQTAYCSAGSIKVDATMMLYPGSNPGLASLFHIKKQRRGRPTAGRSI